MTERGPRDHRGIRGRALVWKRFDFRESSRIVAVWFRDHGVLHALAKGAHRPDSPLLGCLDFLNELDVTLSPTKEGLRLLLRARLLRERRGLRQSRRYLAASHLCELCDAALPQERADAELFDLVDGGLTLLERCPPAAIPVVALGLEVRLLLHLGSLPDLDHCSECGRDLAAGAFRGEVAGAITCRTHAAAPRRAIAGAALATLRQLRDLPGRQWPDLASTLSPGTAILPTAWLAQALERHGRMRKHVFPAAQH